MAKRKLSADFILQKNRQERIDREVARQRLSERDARAAADTRTPAQVWLNDPAPGRSALAQKPATGSDRAPDRTGTARLEVFAVRC